jgi:hypothetical protein
VPKQGETSTKTSKRPRPEGSTPTEMARAPKRPRDFSGPGTYMEALTNIKMAIFGETYPEDKLNEDDQNYILEELGKVLHRTPIGELPHLKSYRLEGGTLIYRCTDQQSGQLLVKATDNHRLGTGARLKITDARNLPKPVKVALRTRDKVSQTQDELIMWIKNLNPGLNTEHWKILDRQSEPTGQRIILHIDWDSLVSDEPSLSDHRYICFLIHNITNYVTFVNPKKTKWESYKDDLRGNLEFISRKI